MEEKSINKNDVPVLVVKNFKIKHRLADAGVCFVELVAVPMFFLIEHLPVRHFFRPPVTTVRTNLFRFSLFFNLKLK